MGRNPNWTRDELILALDLYFRENPLHTSENNLEIIKLSKLLNKLPIHPEEDRTESFRNPSGVYMKLCNFLRIDPGYEGEGLNAGSKLDEEVWREFIPEDSLDSIERGKIEIGKIATKISTQYEIAGSISYDKLEQDEYSFREGRIIERLHKIRERNSRLVDKKKKQVLAEFGRLKCEVCGFDFAERYRDIGNGFIECHHNVPLSTLETPRTKLSDLSLVCSNCHSMLHRARPWMAVQELKRALVET